MRRAVAGDAMALGGVWVFASARQGRKGSPSSPGMQAEGFQCEGGVESVQLSRAGRVCATHWFCGIGNNREGGQALAQRRALLMEWSEILARR